MNKEVKILERREKGKKETSREMVVLLK